jgi:hypothetical protein
MFRRFSGDRRRLRLIARILTGLVALGVALTVVAGAATPAPPPSPAPEAIPALTDAFFERLAGRGVPEPDGGAELPLVGETGSLPAPLLTRDRLRRCLETVTEAEGWPAAWLVVQDADRAFDLVMRLELGADGQLQPPPIAFTVARRDWDDRALEAAVREATGRRPPRERSRNLVIQGFTRRTVTRYVYRLPDRGKEARGLEALLPPGSMIREARSVDLGDGLRHTLGVALVRPEFLPADCAGETGRRTGHLDAAEQVLLVLAGEKELDATLDLTAALGARTGAARLPRYRCEPGDEEADLDDLAPGTWFEGRELVPLIQIGGPDGAPERELGLRLAIEPPGETLTIRLQVDAPRLILLNRR